MPDFQGLWYQNSNVGYGVKEERRLWVVEASLFPFKKWAPVFSFNLSTVEPGARDIPGFHLSRQQAREAAKKMQEKNKANKYQSLSALIGKSSLWVKYRAVKYVKLAKEG